MEHFNVMNCKRDYILPFLENQELTISNMIMVYHTVMNVHYAVDALVEYFENSLLTSYNDSVCLQHSLNGDELYFS